MNRDRRFRASVVALAFSLVGAACGSTDTAPPLVTAPADPADLKGRVTTSLTQVDCPESIADSKVACGIAEVELDRADSLVAGDSKQSTSKQSTSKQSTSNKTASDAGVRPATVSISVATLRGYDDAGTDPMVVLQGGPGGASTDLAAWFPQRAFTQVFIDQRGTGFAGLDFDCPEFDDAIPGLLEVNSNEETRRTLDALGSCARRLESDPAANELWSKTNTANHALDVVDVMRALGHDRWLAYGVSYGSTIGLELMRQQPSGLAGVVLDGVYPPNLDVEDVLPQSAESAIAALTRSCRSDDDCRSMNPDVSAGLDQLVQDLNANPMVVTLDADAAGFGREVDVLLTGDRLASFVFLILYSETLTRTLPAALAGMAQDDPEPTEWLVRVGAQLMGAGFGANDEATYYAVQCRDRLPILGTRPGPTLDPAPNPAPDPALNKPALSGFSRAVEVISLTELCPLWDPPGVEASPGLGSLGPVSSDTPALLLSGEFDPITPPGFADLAAETLSNVALVTQRGRGHGIWSGNDCIGSIVDDFVADPNLELDTSCADSGVPVDWNSP